MSFRIFFQHFLCTSITAVPELEILFSKTKTNKLYKSWFDYNRYMITMENEVASLKVEKVSVVFKYFYVETYHFLRRKHFTL